MKNKVDEFYKRRADYEFYLALHAISLKIKPLNVFDFKNIQR